MDAGPALGQGKGLKRPNEVAVNAALLPSIAATGFAIAFMHAALPTHWLPFVLAGRGQGWGRGKTLGVVLLSGAAHVVFTVLLGVLVVWLGVETSRWAGGLFAYLASGVLILFGLFYLFRQSAGMGHRHVFAFRRAADGVGESVDDGRSAAAPRPTRSDKAVILGLLAAVTLSPCEGFLPIYLAGIGYGFAGFLLLSAVLTGATLAGMVVFTSIALVSLERLKLAALERYENAVIGGLLCFLGVLVLVFEG